MQVTKSNETACSVTLKFQFEVDEVGRAFEQAYRQLARVTDVPGFRPGKAPRAVLEKLVSADRVRERAASVLGSKAYRDALDQHELVPYSDSMMDGDDPIEGEPWEFTATVYLAPQVTLGSTDGLAVERPVYTIEDADVDSEVEMVRRDYRRATPVEGRGLTAEDAAIADLSVMVEGIDEEPNKRRTLITFGDNIPGFDEAVLGMTAGEERSFALTYPEDHQDSERAGQRAQFTVRVDSIFRYELPELTDAWVKNTLGFESVDELRELIRHRLESDARDRSDREAETRIVTSLVERSELAYPESMMDEERAEEYQRVERTAARAGMTMEQYLERAGMAPEQLEEEVTARCEARLRSGLVLRELARREGVAVSAEEIDAALERLTDDTPEAQRRLRRLQQDQETRTEVANRLLRAKLRELLFRIAAMTDVPAERGA